MKKVFSLYIFTLLFLLNIAQNSSAEEIAPPPLPGVPLEFKNGVAEIPPSLPPALPPSLPPSENGANANIDAPVKVETPQVTVENKGEPISQKERDAELKALLSEEKKDKVVVKPASKNIDDADYKTQILPESIYKKKYDKPNAHLPPSRYKKDIDNYLIAESLKGDINNIRALLDLGHDPNIQNEHGATPLMTAVLSGHSEAVLLLLLRNADTNIRDNRGVAALHVAAQVEKADLVEALLYKKANPNIQTNLGTTPLHIAASSGNVEIIKILLVAKAYPDVQDNSGNTPLMLATIAGKSEAAHLLLEAGSSPDTQNEQGFTALHYAVKSGNMEVVSAILHAGANPEIANIQGVTPEDVAIASRHLAIAKEIYNASAAYKRDRQPHLANEKKITTKQWQELSEWMEMDRKFDKLSNKEKKYWNERRKVLQGIFPEYFTAKTPEDQQHLDEYLAKWSTLDKKKPAVAKKESQSQPKKEPPLTEEQKELHEMLNSWKDIDKGFATFSIEEKKDANELRLELLNGIYDGTPAGKYATAFKALSKKEQQAFFDGMKKWDDFVASLAAIDKTEIDKPADKAVSEKSEKESNHLPPAPQPAPKLDIEKLDTDLPELPVLPEENSVIQNLKSEKEKGEAVKGTDEAVKRIPESEKNPLAKESSSKEEKLGESISLDEELELLKKAPPLPGEAGSTDTMIPPPLPKEDW